MVLVFFASFQVHCNITQSLIKGCFSDDKSKTK
jgi:hypothetical protein